VTKEARTVLAAMPKREIVALLVRANPEFSEKKLSRLSRDDILEIYTPALLREIEKEAAE